MELLLLAALASVSVAVGSRSELGPKLDFPEAGRTLCSQLTASWTKTPASSLSEDWSDMYRLKVVLLMSEDGPQHLVFPEQLLFRFVRRMYRCCQMGYKCRWVQGLQGRETGGSTAEFVLYKDVWSAPILGAEVHLYISNPHNLNIWPLLPWLEKRHLPTQYSVLWRDSGMLHVRVNLLLIVQTLQALAGRQEGFSVMDIQRVMTHKATKERPSQHSSPVPIELVLALHCSTMMLTPLPCECHGVQLLHPPFIILFYN